MGVKRITVQSVEIDDKPGSLQKFLELAASEDVDLKCFAAFSAGDGRGKVYVSAKDQQVLEACAKEAHVEATVAAGFIVDGEDKVGAAAEALKGLAEAGINGVAGTAMVCGGQYRMLVVVAAGDGDAAAKALGG